MLLEQINGPALISLILLLGMSATGVSRETETDSVIAGLTPWVWINIKADG